MFGDDGEKEEEEEEEEVEDVTSGVKRLLKRRFAWRGFSPGALAYCPCVADLAI